MVDAARQGIADRTDLHPEKREGHAFYSKVLEVRHPLVGTLVDVAAVTAHHLRWAFFVKISAHENSDVARHRPCVRHV